LAEIKTFIDFIIVFIIDVDSVRECWYLELHWMVRNSYSKFKMAIAINFVD